MTEMIPKRMRGLVAPKYTDPSGYEVVELPVPTLQKEDDVLIKVHAGGVFTGDTQFVSGAFKFIVPLSFPHRIGIVGAGIVAAVGSRVKRFRVGDEVYGMHTKHPQLPPTFPGYCSEYALTEESKLLLKPPHLSFEEAASILASSLTAFQSIKRGLELMEESSPGTGTLEGKTAFVPGALSATGSVGIQMLKNVFGVGKVISTVSTAKLPLVDQYLGPGMVDHIIDYKTQDVVKELGKESCDFVYNTQWQLVSTFPLLKPDTGVVISIASIPSSGTLRKALGPQYLPFWMAWLVDLVQLYYSWKLWGTHIRYEFVSGNGGIVEDLEAVGEIIAAGKIRPVMRVVKLDDIDAVRKACNEVYTGKGGIGQLVVKI
ncbi:GroES-like protein, partial [Diplogelasinospora grovesii]